MEIVGNIYKEENYDVFRRLPGNRDVVSRRLNKLMASISEHYVLSPIIVNEKLEIIDGQGRFEVLKTLGLPIYYVISPGATREDCVRMNKYNTQWGSLDFAQSYANTGVQSYVRLLKTCTDTKLSINRTLRLSNHVTQSGHSSENMSSFEKGLLNFSAEDMETVKKVKSMADDIATALQFTGRRNDAFYTAVKIISETSGYNHKRMVNHCAACRSSYSQMSRLADQLVEFERIYNYKTTSGNRIYFSDYMRNRGANVRDYDTVYSRYTDKDVLTIRSME